MEELTTLTNMQLDELYRDHVKHGFFQIRREEIEAEVRKLGADTYDMWLPETHILPIVVHPNEMVTGIVFGRYQEQNNGHLIGRGALVATDKRVILVDRKPLFLRCDEITYDVVSGVTYGRVGFIGTVTLHTRMGDIKMRTFNQHCAVRFVEAIEAIIFAPEKSEAML